MTSVRKSSIDGAGNGVFTAKSFKKGEVVCFYDGEDREMESVQDFLYSMNHPPGTSNKPRIGWYAGVRTVGGTGQFINDAAEFKLSETYRTERGTFCLYDTRIDRDIDSYLERSMRGTNVAFKDGGFDFVATRDLVENEELFITYGLEYWECKIRFETNQPCTKLFCLLKFGLLKENGNNFTFDEREIKATDVLDMLHIPPKGRFMQFMEWDHLTAETQLLCLIDLLK